MHAEIIPFFFLNHRLDNVRYLRGVVRDAAAAGCDGLFLHPREGLLTPYLSGAWFEAIGACVDEARRRGVKAWIYDEFPYPSGVAGGKVVESDPRFAERHLRVRHHLLAGGRRPRLVLGTDPVLRAFLSPVRGGRPDRRAARDVTADVGPMNDTWIKREWDSRWYYDRRHAKLYDCPRSTAHCPEAVFEADLPPGRWELTVFHVRTGGNFREPFGHYVDVSSLEATRRFIEVTHEEYKRRFRRDFGRVIPGVFTDEPKYRNRLPWSETIADGWADYRKDPRALMALVDADPRGGEVRMRYRETAFRLFRDHWARPLARWCARHGLKFTGHISPEEEWFDEARGCGSIAQLLKEFHVPGCDLIIPAVGDRDHPILNFTPTMATSVAAQRGRPQALCELYACSDFSFTLQGMKRISDWLSLFGINVFTPHSVGGWVDGYRKYDAAPPLYKPNPVWPAFGAWTAHARQTAGRLGPLGVKADLVVARPMRTLWRLGVEDRAGIERISARAMRLAQRLLERGLMLHWVDDLDLASARVRGGKVVVGRAAYPAIAHLPGTLDAAGRSALARLRRAGARVLDEAAASRLAGPLRCASGAVRAVRARDGAWFCVNLRPTREAFSLLGKAHALDGYESRWLPPDAAAPAPRRALRTQRLAGRWAISAQNDNVLVLDRWTFRGRSVRPAPYYDHAPREVGAWDKVSIGAIPANPELEKPRRLVYRARFRAEGVRDAALVIEGDTVRGEWQASLNGKPLRRWKGSSRYDPTNREHDLRGLLRRGTNVLEVAVTVSRSTDGLMDPFRIFGRFRARAGRGLPTLLPERRVAGAGDWTRLGWPHYSGTMAYAQDFAWKGPKGGRVELVLDRPVEGRVEVALNGRRAGALLWSPWRLDVTRALRPGRNRLELRVTNTYMNLIYGRPRPSGLLGGARLVACTD
jgi:hypothetical protein